ncbi:MAG TPA: DUF692 domain-containing protein [Polyangiaceae bacterium]|nr:DUF692 domain-containing protein [Polyangiaceae bacterium]
MTHEPQYEATPRGSRQALGGIGLGLRWDFLEEVLDAPHLDVAFFEVSPENYLSRGGYYPAALEQIAERYPIVTHGLTLSIGAIAEPDPGYLSALKQELTRLDPPWHSDHLCFSTAGERVLHELLPLKFCEENVRRVAERARRMEGLMERPFALENITYYVHPGEPELSELTFLNRVLEVSNARLLLDVNNVFVNAQNHGFDPYAFIAGLPLERVVEIHVAGHQRLESGLLLDTHGEKIVDPVLDLLEWTLERAGDVPVLLERDNNVPDLAELLSELQVLAQLRARALARHAERHAKSA